MALSAAVLIAAAVLASPAHAGPPVATPTVAAVPCTALAPERGVAFSGPVLQVIDGRSFCVAEGPTPSSWVKVTLAGVADARDRSDLMAAAFARRVTCVVDRRDQEGVLARCAIDAPSGAAIEPAASQASPVDAATCPKPD